MLGVVHMDGIGLWRHPLHFINHMSYQHLVNCFVNKALAGRIKKGVGVENVNSWCDVKDSVFCGEPDGPPSPSASPPSLPSVYATPPRPYKAWLSHTSCLDHSSLVELPPVTTRSWGFHPCTAKEKESDGLSGPKSRGILRWSDQNNADI